MTQNNLVVISVLTQRVNICLILGDNIIIISYLMKQQDYRPKKKYVNKYAIEDKPQNPKGQYPTYYSQKTLPYLQYKQGTSNGMDRPMKDMTETKAKIEYVGKQTNAHTYKTYDTHKGYKREDKEPSWGQNFQKAKTSYPQKDASSPNKQVSPCDKYFNNSESLEKGSHGLDDKIKKIKKIFLEKYKNVKSQELKIYASKLYPMIYFEFKEEGGPLKQRHFREVIKDISTLKDTKKRQMFQQIFQRIFHKVQQKYYSLAVFAVEQAKAIKINLHKDLISNLGQGSEVMFYYMKGGEGPVKQINFTIFDKFLRSIQFSNNFIHKNRYKYPDEYAVYEKFYKKVFTQETVIEGQLTDLMNNQEVESDDERVNLQEKSVDYFKIQLSKLLDKNLNGLQEKIENLTNQVMTMGRSGGQNQNLLKLTEQLQYLEENKTNFESVRQTVAQERSQFQSRKTTQVSAKQFYKKSLKKMVIAQKQLESKLPIIAKKRKIFELLKTQNLLIIEGETGSGKSTQLPQMLCQLYDLLDNPKALPVLVTQPRRLATRSLAERVAKQMGEEVGGFVDYMASAGKRVNEDAKIIFKLDRLVLDELTEDPVLSRYSCLIIDEAHERTISIDVILGLVKQLLKTRKDFKVIVTSASMDIHLFENYFSTKTLKVSGRMYPVTITYKDYAKYKEGDKLEQVRKIQRVINEQILHDTSSMKDQFKGHLLCFCSNIDEINELVRIYSSKLNKNVFTVFALHGKITPAEQKQVFEQNGKHKIIFGNRIAETAITIDGVRVVIDPGKDVELVYDQKYKVSSMKLQEITQSSAKQRAGRSGRTGPGHCFRLYSQENFRHRKVNKVPEMENASLQTVVLRLKTLKINDVVNFSYISTPSIDGLKKSVELLKLIGALAGKDQTVTKIGQLLVKIPIQPFLSRAIIEGMMFQKSLQTPGFCSKLKMPKQQLAQIRAQNIQSTVIQILSLIVNFSNLFFVKKQDREQGQKKKFEFSDEEGDFFFLDNIFRKYKQMKSSGNQQGKKCKNPKLYQWMRQNYLNFKAFSQTEDLVKEISEIVKEFTIKASVYQEELDNTKSKLMECKSYRQVILSCLITSFSPNLCKYSGNPQIGYTMVSQRRPLQIYGTSNLSLLGIPSDWIICYDLNTNEVGLLYCKVAHAITYDFMKKHIDRYIWQTFKVNQIQNCNPFYKEISQQLPTKILQQIRFDYYKSETDERFAFLKDAFPMISQQQNRISFFFMVQDKDFGKGNSKESQISKDFQHKIAVYKQNMKKELSKSYRHNYIGNIFVNMQDGYQIQEIEFNNIQFCVQITSELTMIEIIAAHSAEIEWLSKHIVQDLPSNTKMQTSKTTKTAVQKNQRKMKVFIMDQRNKNNFLQYLNELKKSNPNIETAIKETLVDKRRKIPQTKIILQFFAGKCTNQNAFMLYEEANEGNQLVQQMCQKIQKAITTERLARMGTGRRGSSIQQGTFKVSKRGNGINVFNIKADQLQIAQQLLKMDKNNLLGLDFKFPNYIKRFRQPQISAACKDDSQWKEQIYLLLEKIHVKTQNLTINIRGYYKPDKDDRKDKNTRLSEMGAFQKRLRVDMTAEITTLDQSILSKMKNAYDGRTGKLGCQKLHIRTYYDQVIAMPALKAFQSLGEEYQYHVGKFKVQYPLMTFTVVSRRFRNKEKVMIIAHSPNKQDFIKTQRIITNLFTSKLIKLQFSEFRFLNKMSDGDEIISDIEKQYNFKIYFGFERFNNSLKVYCEDAEVKGIEKKIKERISKFKYYSQKISYRGKNLNKVKELLDNKIATLQNGKMLCYQIMFQKRDVLVTADLNTFQQTSNDIKKLVNADKGDCGICADIMRNPYRFLNCKCSSVLLTIPEAQKLLCPNEECQALINVNDVKTLLSQDEFQGICDIKIGNYIKRNKNKYLSCNFCQNIFDKQDSQKSGELNCEICGRSECIKCGQSHTNYTCEQWKYKDQTKQLLKELGVKQCPSCNQGIQKSGGCNHMECKNCKTHICWKCLKTFKESKQCYNHLSKECGGIFDIGTVDDDHDGDNHDDGYDD